MDKNLDIGMLMDFYGQMLTDKQADAVDFYYNQDFSLSEIAEQMEITRQGVRDLIKRAEKQLFEFEESLGLVERFLSISRKLKKIEICCNELYEKSNEEQTKEIINEISGLIGEITEKI